MTIFKEAKSGIAFINYIDQEGKRRKKSTVLPYAPADSFGHLARSIRTV